MDAQKLPIDYGAWIGTDDPALGPSIVPNSPAAKAGLTDGDIITSVNGTRIDAAANLDEDPDEVQPRRHVDDDRPAGRQDARPAGDPRDPSRSDLTRTTAGRGRLPLPSRPRCVQPRGRSFCLVSPGPFLFPRAGDHSLQPYANQGITGRLTRLFMGSGIRSPEPYANQGIKGRSSDTVMP